MRARADVLLTAEQAAALAQHADAGLRGDLLLHHIIDATHKYSLVDVAKLMQVRTCVACGRAAASLHVMCV